MGRTMAADGFEGEVVKVARAFHEAYEALAPAFGYETRKESAVPWDEVPEKNRVLMCSVVQALISEGVIITPAAVDRLRAATALLTEEARKEQP